MCQHANVQLAPLVHTHVHNTHWLTKLIGINCSIRICCLICALPYIVYFGGKIFTGRWYICNCECTLLNASINFIEVGLETSFWSIIYKSHSLYMFMQDGFLQRDTGCTEGGAVWQSLLKEIYHNRCQQFKPQHVWKGTIAISFLCQDSNSSRSATKLN